MISVLETGTGEPSSSLAKGVAKEKELARDLRIKNPSATVTRTPQTGDGGKDLVVVSGERRLYYEVKNWERSMSVYDLERYVTLHQDSNADVRVFNEGGFSDAARQFASEAGVELTAGSDYTPPSSGEVTQWCFNRVRSVASRSVKKAASSISRTVIRITKSGKRLVYQGARYAGPVIKNTAEKIQKRLSFRQLAIFGIIFGPIWLYHKWRKGEYSHSYLAKLVGGILLCLILDSIFKR